MAGATAGKAGRVRRGGLDWQPLALLEDAAEKQEMVIAEGAYQTELERRQLFLEASNTDRGAVFAGIQGIVWARGNSDGIGYSGTRPGGPGYASPFEDRGGDIWYVDIGEGIEIDALTESRGKVLDIGTPETLARAMSQTH